MGCGESLRPGLPFDEPTEALFRGGGDSGDAGGDFSVLAADRKPITLRIWLHRLLNVDPTVSVDWVVSDVGVSDKID